MSTSAIGVFNGIGLVLYPGVAAAAVYYATRSGPKAIGAGLVTMLFVSANERNENKPNGANLPPFPNMRGPGATA
jgi:hypothetical protein